MRTYRAILKVASTILTGLTSALLIEIPLTTNIEHLTYNVLLCILNVVISIAIERYLEV